MNALPAWLAILAFLMSMVLPGSTAAAAENVVPGSATAVPRVNIPYLNQEIALPQTAIFWFGRVTDTDNYVDARLAYTSAELYVHLSIIDRRLWYDPNPSASTLTQWDSASLYLNLAGNTGAAPTSTSYRFDAQLSDWEDRNTGDWQTAFRGDGSGWTAAGTRFTTQTGYRWGSVTEGGLNNDTSNRGWTLDFHVPFASLGLAAPPASGALWGLAVAVHDRDTATGALTEQVWPTQAIRTQPASWGQLRFGLPAYQLGPANIRSQTVVRQGLAGAVVADGAVGGDTVCGEGMNFWSEWGNANYAGRDYFNVQNQADIADWPCFSKYYVTFPITSVPAGKTILGATLTLHQFGGSGEGETTWPSYIQVLTAASDWDPSSLTWNTAPQAGENISGAWVDPLGSFPAWPGVAHNWDVSRAVAEAYATGQPVRLVLYSADEAQHSGRYFTSSEAEDWDAVGRPTLTITWGTQITNPRKAWIPALCRP